MLPSTEINLYLNWSLYATLGKLREADALMKQHGSSIQIVAEQLRRKLPFESKPLYRGMLLDPTKPLRPMPQYTFLSWSEDRDVARWFGTCDTNISAPLAESDPNLRGYVLTLDEAPSRVLFHWSWASAFGAPLAWFALRHPDMGPDGARQIDWMLRTQREVIIEPLTTLPEAKPTELLDGPCARELDRRLTPPWCSLQ